MVLAATLIALLLQQVGPETWPPDDITQRAVNALALGDCNQAVRILEDAGYPQLGTSIANSEACKKPSEPKVTIKRPGFRLPKFYTDAVESYRDLWRDWPGYSDSGGQPVYDAAQCVGAVVDGVCHGSVIPNGSSPKRCYGQMLNGQCTGPMF